VGAGGGVLADVGGGSLGIGPISTPPAEPHPVRAPSSSAASAAQDRPSLCVVATPTSFAADVLSLASYLSPR
jgi:hypothetical protein